MNPMPKVIAVSIAMVVVLAGCAPAESSDREDAQVQAPAAPVVSSPTPTPLPTSTADTPAPLAAPFAYGDVIGDQDLDRLFATTSFGVYLLPDGSYVVTDPARPLPDSVTSDVQARLDAIGADDPSDNGSSAMAHFEAEQAIQASVSAAGKNVVTVRLRRMAVPNPDGSTGGFRWVASSNQTGWWMQWEQDRDVLVGNVQSWVSQNGPGGGWVVFVGPGARVSP